MTTSLDVSRKIDPISVELLLAVDSTAAALGLAYCIVGAFSRDVVLSMCFGINTGQATRDIDFGLMMDDWEQFEALRSRLFEQGFKQHRNIPHRLTFRGMREIDIVPFGAIERSAGEIAWPPEFSTVMSTVGLLEAHARALRITIAAGVSIPFVSPAGLALLKLVAWSGRGSAVDRKDAHDLALLLTSYLQAGNETRLYDEHASLLDEADFDWEAAGARILGRDIGDLTGNGVRAQLEKILDRGTDPSQGEPLLRAMPLRSEHAERLLQSLRQGLRESADRGSQRSGRDQGQG
jgi:predicted nucleotidyltransferase